MAHKGFVHGLGYVWTAYWMTLIYALPVGYVSDIGGFAGVCAIQPASIISYVVYSYGATTFYRSKLCKLAELKVVIVVQSSDIHS